MSSPWSRRAFCSFLAVSTRAADGNTAVPSEMRRLRDPATEFELTRLTDPSSASAILPRAPLRGVSGKYNFLLYCSDRSGTMQAFRMDLKTGESRQWTSADALDPASVSLLPDDKSLICTDGNQLIVHSGKPKVVYAAGNGWEFRPGLAVSDDGSTAALVEHRSGRFRVRVIALSRNSANTIFEAGEPVSYIRLRPKRPGVLYNHAGALTLVGPTGLGSKRLNTAEGEAGDALFSADGSAVEYLSTPQERRRGIQLRENLLDTGEDKLIGQTSQFTSFARNADASVFAGVSGSKASPYVLLLIRSARRELTLAEHRATSASAVSVAFSPNSQRLFYTSDREGKSAIYAMVLDRFVEKTEFSARAESHEDVLS